MTFICKYIEYQAAEAVFQTLLQSTTNSKNTEVNMCVF